MKLCDEKHDPIVYESIYCPACSLAEEADGLAAELEKAKDAITDLEAELKELQKEAA